MKETISTYGVAVAGIIAIGITPYGFHGFYGSIPLSLLTLLAIIAMSWFFGLWPGVTLTTLGTSTAAILKLQYLGAANAELTHSSLEIGTYIASGIVLSVLVSAFHAQEKKKKTILENASQLLERERTARLKAESTQRELDQSQKAIALVAESVPDLIWSSHPDGFIDYQNRRFSEYTGLPLEQTKGWGFQTLIHPVDIPHYKKLVSNALRSGEPYEMEFRIRRWDGTYRWHIARGVPLKNHNGDVVRWYGTCTDVHYQKEMSEYLHLNEQRFRTALKGTSICVFNQDRNLRYQWVYNPQPPLTPQHVVGHVDSDLWSSREEVALLENLKKRVMDTGVGLHTEVSLTLPDGSRHTFDLCLEPFRDSAGELVGITGASVDITERKRLEEALRTSERRFHDLADAMPQMMWIATADGSAFTYFNRRWYEYTGFDERLPTQVEHYVSILHPDDVARTLETWKHAIQTGTPYVIEYRFRDRKTGTYRWHLGRAEPIRDRNGTITLWYGTCTDIDAQKRAEERLLEDDRRKDQFISMLSHELRNPLAAIKGALVLLREENLEEEEARSLHEMVDSQADHLIRLLDDLLDVSRITRGKIELKKEPIELRPVMERLVKVAKARFSDHQHRFNIVLPEQPVFIEADTVRFEQMIGNLLTNASKYTDRGGTISILVEPERDWVRIRIRDTGIGIAPDMMARIFEPFVQVEHSIGRSDGGLGLGLAVVKTLTEMHGGTISAKSDGPGKGSEFTVELPLAVPPPRHALKAKSKSIAFKTFLRKQLKVLVADDNVDFATGITQFLTLKGYDVEMAHDGKSAIEACRLLKPHIVLLDIGLPDITGYDVAQTLQREFTTSEIPYLIAISGFGLEQDRRRSQEAGFRYHLVKPVNYETLLSIITSLDSVALETAQNPSAAQEEAPT